MAKTPIILKEKGVRTFATPEEKKKVLEIEARAREKKGVIGKALEAQKKIITSPKTTAVLGGVLAAEIAVAAGITGAAATAGRGVISRTATIGSESLTTQRAFVGRAAHKSPEALNKIFHKVRPVAAKFATNKKSMSLTRKLWLGLGMSVGAAFVAKDIYGTYPYAEFIGKEEALQTVGIPIFLAIEAGDLEGAEKLIEEQKEIMAADLGKVPYKNIRNAIVNYQKAQVEAIIEFERLIAKKRGEIEFEAKTVGEEIAERDIREKEEQERRDKEFEEAQKERDIKKIEELEFESKYYKLIREKKYAEAEDLQAEYIKKLKGGV